MQNHSIFPPPPIPKEKSACFSGYRLQKFPPNTNFEKIKLALRNAIADLVQRGYTTFLSGMAEGFDMMAAEEVVKLKTINPHIKFIAVIPCHEFREFSLHDAEIFNQADEVIAVSDKVETKAYHARNRFMVDNSSTLVCYFDGKGGGTKYTVNYATLHKKQIINLS